MKQKVGFLILFFSLCLGLYFFVKNVFYSHQIPINFFSGWDQIAHSEIDFSGTIMLQDNKIKDQVYFEFSGFVDHDKSDLNGSFSREHSSDKLGEDYVLSGFGEIFREMNFLYLQPKMLSWYGGVGNIRNQFFEDIFSGMLNKTFQLPFYIGDFDWFLKLKDRNQDKDLNLSYKGKKYLLTMRENEYFFFSKEKYIDNFFVSLKGVGDGDILRGSGYWGKWNVLFDISAGKFVCTVSEIMNPNRNLFLLIEWKAKPTKKSLQSFGKPYTQLRDFFESF